MVDKRTLPATSLGAVRVVNRNATAPNGLTVATGRPLYVLGDYNNGRREPGNHQHLHHPAGFTGGRCHHDSVGRLDGREQHQPGGSAHRAPTTVNAAFLTGAVDTTLGYYSGGMENFPRFLETWGLANVFTYNGSMIKMFPSLYATNVWGSTIFTIPPARNWAFDANFDDPTKLPPKTPSLLQGVSQPVGHRPSGHKCGNDNSLASGNVRRLVGFHA